MFFIITQKGSGSVRFRSQNFSGISPRLNVRRKSAINKPQGLTDHGLNPNQASGKR